MMATAPSALPAWAAQAIALSRQQADCPDFLGDERLWPATLRTLCAIMFASNQPMFVVWGEQRSLLYNEAYGEILGERHPSAFGLPMPRVWSDVWDVVGPILERAYRGVATHMDDLALRVIRHGVPQEAHFSFSYTPVSGAESGSVLGVFCACAETTESVQPARLHAAEELRRLQLFQKAPGFIAVLSGPQHVFEFANDAFNRLSGGRELIGRTARQAFPEGARQPFYELLDQVYATGERFVARGMAVHLQATPQVPLDHRFVDLVYEPVTDAGGAVTGIFIDGADVTDAVLAQRQLHDSNAHHQEVLNAMSEGFIVMDDQFRILEINAEGLRIDGRRRAEIIGRSHWELWPASVGTPVQAAYRKVVTDRVAVELRHHYLSGAHDVWFEIRAYPVAGGAAAFYRDVTALATAQTRLQHSDARFRAAVEAIGVLWTNDAEGRMSGAQPGWSQLTGQTEAEYRGFGWAAAVHPDDAQPTLDAWLQAVAETRTFTFEHRVRRHDGQWRRFAIRAVPVLETTGAVREWVGVHIDITQAALATEALHHADRRKDVFLATLAHELRNPLATIRTAAHLLNRPDLPADKLAWVSEVLARQTHIMVLLLDDLLDLSRITNGRVTLKKERVNVESVVRSAVETSGPQIAAKRHTLRLALPDTPLFVHADPLRLAQVLTNLLTNAAKYTDAGGTIQVVAGGVSGHVQIDIIDSGVGIAAESLAKIFEMFEQIPGTLDRSEGGLGVGLALTKGLVELHGGSIEPLSAGPGQGSTFRLTLPAAAAHSSTDSAADSAAQAPGSA